jgi:hypothetical protein
MEAIIEFMQQYWGISVLGTTTVGAIITFIVTTLMSFSRDKKKNGTIEMLLAEIAKISTAAEAKVNAAADKLTTAEQQLVVLGDRNKKNEMVTATIFETLSYIVVASKLPIEDKTALLAKYAELAKATAVEVVVAAAPSLLAAPGAVVAAPTVSPMEIIQKAVGTAASLLEKYTVPKTGA